MDYLQSLSLDELFALRQELQAEVVYCGVVRSPDDLAGTQGELHNIAVELANRQAQIAAHTTAVPPTAAPCPTFVAY